MNPAYLLRARTILLWTMLLSVLASVGMFSLWIMADDMFGEVITFGLLLLAAYSFTALLCMNLLCRGRFVAVMWTGIGASALAFLIWQPVLAIEWWRLNVNESSMIFFATACTVVTGWCALFAALHSATWVSALAQVISYLTLGIAGLIGVMTMAAVIEEPYSNVFWGLFGILCLLGGCGLLASVSLTLMARGRATGIGETISGNIRVELTCPRCGSEQSMRTGLSRCTSCGLRIELTVEEPVCECGYQLYQLTGMTCPECGREIPREDRWAVHADGTAAQGATALEQ